MSEQLTRHAQAYAPLAAATASGAAERFLYLFACLGPGCRSSDDSWCALRAQHPTNVPVAAEAPAVPAPAAAAVSDDWGVSGADDWGASDVSEAAPDDSGAELSSLAEQLSAALESAAEARAKPRVQPPAQPREARIGKAAQRPAPGPLTLPEFYIVATEEPEDETVSAEAPAWARATQLAAEYERTAATGARAGDSDGDGDGVGWAGEEYESVSVRGVSKAALKYQKRLARCATQCVRYGGTDPMWPSDRRPPRSVCGRCGSERVPEAQLMAPLVHFFEEGLTPGCELSDAVVEWEWTTVLLSTCPKARLLMKR